MGYRDEVWNLDLWRKGEEGGVLLELEEEEGMLKAEFGGGGRGGEKRKFSESSAVGREK